MKISKYGLILTLTIALCATLCACGAHININGADEAEEPDKVSFIIKNTEGTEIDVLSVSWLLDGETIGTTGVEVAAGGTLDAREYDFELNQDELAEDSDLNKLQVQIKVRNDKGVETSLAPIAVPSELGDTYKFELRNDNGELKVQKVK